MNLFVAAGIDLPATPGARRSRAISRSLKKPLFNHRVVEDAARRGNPAFVPTPEQVAAAADYARKARDPNFLKTKETAIRHRLIEEVLQTVLGYRPVDPGQPYSLALEHPIRGGSVDVALGAFNAADGAADEIIAPFELKGPDSLDLDRIMPGRGRSPVQQAWDYAIDAPGSRWVLVSNCLEIRLYAFGRGRDAYERFDLTRLDDPWEHQRLWRILSARCLFGGSTDQLLKETDSAYQAITDDLYRDYAGLRGRLIDFLGNPAAAGVELPRLKTIEIAQKLLDRVLFIAFAQRTDLMQDRLLHKAATTVNDFNPNPLWTNFLSLFRAVDQGNAKLDIPAYNGGLFADDPHADQIVLPDHLAVDIARLGEWDYRHAVNVTVLGRLFEQSITDIEALKSGEAPKVSKRKREGVVYTPDSITRFLVEQTVGRTLDETRAALWAEHGMWEPEPNAEGPDPDRAIGFWRSYLEALRDFTIVDPACGSGAFLVAAFDEMARRYRDATDALDALGVEPDFDVIDEIVTRNLYGVDLNPESVEITRLALWLKTARRDHRLQNLEATIRDGNSLIADPAQAARPFDWTVEFPAVRARGGFDVVIGNPPYVRMEHLKPIKPYLAQHYVVADDRTDLYAYFFELGVRVLKDGGRLGFISSSTFFRTGSGRNLRTFLGDGAGLETVVDFGDVQLFQGVTTYPTILTLKKGETGADGALNFLGVRDKAPEDLGRAFSRHSKPMPRARLGNGSWRFEDNTLSALRDKVGRAHPSLKEVLGSPIAGVKTGLNRAFVVKDDVLEALLRRDPKSSDLIKPFAMGDDVAPWVVGPAKQHIIYIPRGAIDIDAYPAIRDHLAGYREALEARALDQAWFELQQSQPGYEPTYAGSKIVFRDISDRCTFAYDKGTYLDMTCFAIMSTDFRVLAYLNSSLTWYWLKGLTPEVRGGFARLKRQFVSQVPLPEILPPELGQYGEEASKAARLRKDLEHTVQRRIQSDLGGGRKLTRKLAAWHTVDFSTFRAEVKAAFKQDIPLNERGDWEAWLAESTAEVRRLSGEIERAEREIDAIVYRLFDLTPEEIGLLEASIAGQH